MSTIRLLTFALFTCLLLVAGCCAGDSNFLTFGVGGGGGYTTIDWGTEYATSSPVFSVSFPRDKSARGELIELFQDGDAIPIAPEIWERNNQLDNGCGWSTVYEYDLGGLEPGRYDMIHRRENGTGGRLNCLGSCPWEEFDGSEVVRLRLIITESDGGAVSLDAGASDVSEAEPDGVDDDTTSTDAPEEVVEDADSQPDTSVDAES